MLNADAMNNGANIIRDFLTDLEWVLFVRPYLKLRAIQLIVVSAYWRV